MIIKVYEEAKTDHRICLDMGGDIFSIPNVDAYRIGRMLMDQAIASCSRAKDDPKRLTAQQLEIDWSKVRWEGLSNVT